ncbi:MAG: fluoride efflux transporter CrcB [Pseudomonadales bacterium]
MYELAAIGIGGAAGALARYGVTHYSNFLFGTHFPYGTLIVNIAGSFLIGVLFVLFTERSMVSPVLRSASTIGFLGAFTTFSAFSLQSLALMEEGRLAAAFMYVVGSVIICILAAGGGMFLGRQLP